MAGAPRSRLSCVGGPRTRRQERRDGLARPASAGAPRGSRGQRGWVTMPATFHHGVGGGGEEFPAGRAWCSNRKPRSRPGLLPPGDPSSPASRAPPARELAPELTASGPRSQVPGRSASSSKRLRRTPDKNECGGQGDAGDSEVARWAPAAVCDHAVRSPFPWRRARSCPRHGLRRPACWRGPDPLTPAAPVLTPPPGTALSASRGARF